MSILPGLIAWPFLLLLPELLVLMNQLFSSGTLVIEQLPDNMLIYLVLFLYAYVHLSINMYRLVMLGEASVNSWLPVFSLKKIGRFAMLTMLIGLLTMLPVLLTGLPFLQLVMAFLLMPISLNFIHIAIDAPLKYKWQLPFPVHANLFFLQILLPALVTMLFAALANVTGIGVVLTWSIKLILFYWTLVTLALCFQLITADGSKQSP